MNLYRFTSGLLFLALIAQIIMTGALITMLKELGIEDVGKFIVERISMFTPASWFVFGIIILYVSVDVYNNMKRS